MDKNLRNQLVKLIKEVLSEAPAPTIEPPTRPTVLLQVILNFYYTRI